MPAEVATTSNYFSIAVHDEHDAETPLDINAAQTDDQNGSHHGSSKNGLDKASARQNRIAMAVERSREEYQSNHAYTEPGVSDPSYKGDEVDGRFEWYHAETSTAASRTGESNPKMDRQRLGKLLPTQA